MSELRRRVTCFEQAEACYGVITSFGWTIEWRSKNPVPDDAWPIDIIERHMSDELATANEAHATEIDRWRSMYSALVEERDELQSALATARREALEEAIAIADVYKKDALGRIIGEAIRALLSQSVEVDRPAGGADRDRVCFYEREFYVLSNFSAFKLKWKGFEFDTSEAAYHWEKFPDHVLVRDSIRLASSAHEAFKTAEHYKALRRPDWDQVKVSIMKPILIQKALQHEYVRRKLLETGDRELVEDSWRDDFWGWGPNRDGQNMLGKLWMEVRAELRRLPAERSEAAPSQSVEVGPTSSGFVLVPREPTEVMLAAGDSAIPRAEPDETGFRMMGREVALECWNAMLSALPSPSTGNGGAGD